jgi:putative heme iron utilization protein
MSEPRLPAHAQGARALLLKEKQALLSTLSTRYAGYPFGSVVPFARWTTGEPLLFLSSLAVHTQNLLADARASLLVSDSASREVQPARLTLLGRCRPLPEAQQSAGRDAFAAAFPDSEALALGGFQAFLFSAEAARWVGGFAAAAWLTGDDLRG